MIERYYRDDFSPWWFLVVPALWGPLLALTLGQLTMEHHHEPGVRHPVQAQMDIPLCYQVEGLPAGYCDQLTKEAP